MAVRSGMRRMRWPALFHQYPPASAAAAAAAGSFQIAMGGQRGGYLTGVPGSPVSSSITARQPPSIAWRQTVGHGQGQG